VGKSSEQHHFFTEWNVHLRFYEGEVQLLAKGELIAEKGHKLTLTIPKHGGCLQGINLPDEAPSDNNNAGKIAGAVVGVLGAGTLAATAVVATTCYCCYQKKRTGKYPISADKLKQGCCACKNKVTQPLNQCKNCIKRP